MRTRSFAVRIGRYGPRTGVGSGDGIGHHPAVPRFPVNFRSIIKPSRYDMCPSQVVCRVHRRLYSATRAEGILDIAPVPTRGAWRSHCSHGSSRCPDRSSCHEGRRPVLGTRGRGERSSVERGPTHLEGVLRPCACRRDPCELDGRAGLLQPLLLGRNLPGRPDLLVSALSLDEAPHTRGGHPLDDRNDLCQRRRGTLACEPTSPRRAPSPRLA